MKKLFLLFSYILLNFNSFSQITVAQWNFDASTAAPTSIASNITATNVTYGTGITGTITYPNGNPSSGKAISNTGWNVASIDLTKYLEVKVAPNSNWAINFNDFKFDGLRSSTGAMNWIIRSSIDNFATNTASGVVNSTFNTNTISLSGTTFQNINSEFAIRIYGFGASGIAGTFRIDNITFTGTIINTTSTLTTNPTTITNLTYATSNGGPSPADSVTVSGSALTGFPSNILVAASTNFEVSKTSKTTGFADNLTVPYTTSSLTNTKIYVRLKSGLSESPYSGTITFSGGGVTTPTTVSLSGSVTAVPPPVITISGTLNAFSTFVGNPSASQSYNVSGVNLTDNITITPPAGYEIRTGAGAYTASLVLPQVFGNVETTSINVRLIGTTAGSFSGNITHTTTGTSAVNVAVTGTVVPFCGTATDIATVRASIPEQATFPTPPATPSSATIVGRVTALFGANKFYIQDPTGGFAVFSNVNGGVVALNGIALGDSVRVTGPKVRFNGEIEFNSVTCINKVTGSISNVPLAVVFNSNTPPTGVNLPTFLDNNEGKLVKVISVNLSSTGSFASASNYPITACNSQGDGEVRIDGTASTINSQPVPTVSQDVTGIVGHYINASATVNIFQLFPRTIADFNNSTITCITPVASSSASCGPLNFVSTPVDSTLDITCWNVEWLGNTTSTPSPLGPTNDAQQMTNVLSVLNTIKSDIFCIEEVCDHKQFTARVKTDLPRYKVRCQTKYYSHFFDSPEIPTDARTFSQKVCFVYDSTVVTMVDTVSLLADVYTYPASNWASGRLPFLFIGNVKIGNTTKQIHFVGLHAKSGSALADYNRRKQDVIDLKAKLDTSYPNANIIMLGDYNDDLDTSIAVGKASSYANFVTDNVNYKQISRALSLCGVSSTAKYPDIIDHFLTSNEFGVLSSSGLTPSSSLSGIYYLEKTINVTRPITYVANYSTTTSDHYPVNARFSFSLPKEIISVNSGNWSSPTTWNCSCLPNSSSNVTIDTGHTVTIDATTQARSLNMKGIINWVSSVVLSLGQ